MYTPIKIKVKATTKIEDTYLKNLAKSGFDPLTGGGHESKRPKNINKGRKGRKERVNMYK